MDDRARFSFRILAARLTLCVLCSISSAVCAELVIDDLEDIADWSVEIPKSSSGSKVSLDATGPEGVKCIRVDYRFTRSAPIVLRKNLSIDLSRYAGMEMWTRGRSPYQYVKAVFVDAKGNRFTCLEDVEGPQFWHRRQVDFSRVRPSADFDVISVRAIELVTQDPWHKNRPKDAVTTGSVSFAGLKLIERSEFPIPIACYAYSIPSIWSNPNNIVFRDDAHRNLTDGRLMPHTVLIPPKRNETTFDIDLSLGARYMVNRVELISLASTKSNFIRGMSISLRERGQFIPAGTVLGYRPGKSGVWHRVKIDGIARTTDMVRVSLNSPKTFSVNEIAVYGRRVERTVDGTQPCRLIEQGEGASRRITLQNGYVKLVVSPYLGGTGVSFVHLKTGRKLTGDNYLFQDLTWVPRKRFGDFSTHVGRYHYEVQQVSPERVAITLWARGKNKELRYLQLRKTISLTRSSSAIRVDNEATLLPDIGIPSQYGLWYHHTTLPFDEGVHWFIPTTKGVVKLDGKSKSEETRKDGARGWIGATNKDSQGIVFTTDLTGVDILYAWFGKNQYTCEWRYSGTELQPGQSILNNYEVFPFAPMENISGAGNSVAMSISKPEIMGGDVAKFTVTLASARKVEGTLIVDTRVLPRPRWSGQTVTKDVSLAPDSVETQQFQFVLPGGTVTSALRVRLLEGQEEVVDAEQLILPGGELDQPYVYAPPPGTGKEIKEKRKPIERFHLDKGIETPHIKWARPYYRGSIKTLALTCFPSIREITELSNRVSLDVHTVPLARMESHLNWLTRSVGKSMSLAEQLQVLDEYLQKNHYEVLVLGGIPWGMLPKTTRGRITDLVRKGMGCVYASPTSERYGQENWPDFLPVGSHGHSHKDALSGSWQSAADHYLTRGIPFDGLPWTGAYRTAEVKGKVLATIGERIKDRVRSHPLLVVGEFGKGRVASLMYKCTFRTDWVPGAGLTPFVGDPENQGAFGRYWEYYYSWLAKCVLWSARREPEISWVNIATPKWPKTVTLPVSFTASARLRNNSMKNMGLRAAATLSNPGGEQVWEGEQKIDVAAGKEAPLQFKLPTRLRRGRHFLNIILHDENDQVVNWGSVTFVAEPPARIAKLKLKNEETRPGVGTGLKQDETLQGHVTIEPRATVPKGARLVIRLVDAFDRTIWERSWDGASAKEIAFDAKPGGVITAAHFLEADLTAGDWLLDSARKRVAIEQTPDRDHFEHNLWDCLPFEFDVREYFLPYYYKILRDMGITAITQSFYRGSPPVEDVRVAENGFKISLNYLAHTAGYHTPALQTEYEKTGDWTKLVRRKCLNDPEEQKKMQKFAARRVGLFARYSPFDCAVGDEGSVTRYNAQSDVCFSPHCLKAMREWLRNEVYKSLEALNSEWDTGYVSWDNVRPLTLKEVRTRGGGNYAPWADHRTFMERTWTNWQRLAGQAIHSKAPHALIGVWGEPNSEAYGGWDYWQLNQVLDTRLPRERGNLDHLVASFARPETRWSRPHGGGAGGDQKDNDAGIAWKMWMTFVVGNNIRQYWMGAMYFDMSTLRPSPHWAETRRLNTEVFGRGLGQLWVAAHRTHDGVAIHYSMPSIHAARATDDHESLSGLRDSWVKGLTELGYAPHFLAPAQIEAGFLVKNDYRLLILPLSKALSDPEAAEIKRFMEQGGIVLATEQCGSMNEHCKPLKANALGKHANLRRTGKLMDEFTFYYTRSNLAATWPKVEALLGEARKILKAANAQPAAHVIRPDGKPLTLCRRYRFLDWSGANEYLAMCRIWNLYQGRFRAQDEAQNVEVRFRRQAHVYDVVEGKYLGETDRAIASFGKSEGKVFALLPRKIGQMTVEAQPQTTRGQPWNYTITFADKGGPPLRRAVRIDVTDPQGQTSHHYSRSEGFLGKQRRLSLWFALNDTPGQWRLNVRDTVSGQVVSKKVEVGAPNADKERVH